MQVDYRNEYWYMGRTQRDALTPIVMMLSIYINKTNLLQHPVFYPQINLSNSIKPFSLHSWTERHQSNNILEEHVMRNTFCVLLLTEWEDHYMQSPIDGSFHPGGSAYQTFITLI